MAVNLPKIADTPYLSLYCNSMKQNDNVTMTFPVNSSLQYFRTAALSMVTSNMESRNPMGRVYAENRSKTQKLLGVKGLTLIVINISPGKKTTYIFILTNILFPFGYRAPKFGMTFLSHFVIHLIFLVTNIN